MLHIELTPYRFLCDITTFTSLFDENVCGERVPDTAAFQCTWQKVQRNNRHRNTIAPTTFGNTSQSSSSNNMITGTQNNGVSACSNENLSAQHTPPVYFKSAHSDMALTFPAMKYSLTLCKDADVLCFQLRPCDFHRHGVSVTEAFINRTSNIDTNTSVVCDQSAISALPQEQRTQLNALLPIIAKGTLDPSLYCHRPRKNYTIKLRDAGGEVIGKLIFALDVLPLEEYERTVQTVYPKRNSCSVHSHRTPRPSAHRSSSLSSSSSSSSSSESSRLSRKKTSKPAALASTSLAPSAIAQKQQPTASTPPPPTTLSSSLATPPTASISEHAVPESYERLDFIVESVVIRDDAIDLRHPPPLPIGEEHYLKIRYHTQRVQSTCVVCNSPREIDFNKQHSFIDLNPGSAEKIHFALWQGDKQVAGFALDSGKFRLVVNKWKAYAIPFRYLPSQQAATLNVSVRRNEATTRPCVVSTENSSVPTSTYPPNPCPYPPSISSSAALPSTPPTNANLGYNNNNNNNYYYDGININNNKSNATLQQSAANNIKPSLAPSAVCCADKSESSLGVTCTEDASSKSDERNEESKTVAAKKAKAITATTTATAMTTATITSPSSTFKASSNNVEEICKEMNKYLSDTTMELLNEHKRLAETLNERVNGQPQHTPLRIRHGTTQQPCKDEMRVNEHVLSESSFRSPDNTSMEGNESIPLSYASDKLRRPSLDSARSDSEEGLSLQTNRLQSHTPLRRHYQQCQLVSPDKPTQPLEYEHQRRASLYRQIGKQEEQSTPYCGNGGLNKSLIKRRSSITYNNINNKSNRYNDQSNEHNSCVSVNSHLPLTTLPKQEIAMSNVISKCDNPDVPCANTEKYVAEVIARIEAHERQHAPHQRSSLVEEWMGWQSSRASSRAPTPHSWRSPSVTSLRSREGSVYSVASSRATSPLPTKSIVEFAFQQPYEPRESNSIRRRSLVQRVVGAPGQRGFCINAPSTVL